MLAMAVLAVAVPMVFAALGESGKCSSASLAETRSTWITAECLWEIRASREGQARYLPASRPGEPFPNTGDVWALAFSSTGKIVGRIPDHQWESAIHTLNNTSIRFIATIESGTTTTHVSSPLPARIIIHYPASAPAHKREQFAFHTLIQ
jgi:hypothetical protein